MTLDLSKPVRTKTGHAVNIYTTDGQNPDFPLVGEYSDEDGDWYAESWSPSGRQNYGSECGEDLINVPEPVDQWMNIYEDEFGPAHTRQELLVSYPCRPRIAIAHIRIHPDRPVEGMIEVVSVEKADD